MRNPRFDVSGKTLIYKLYMRVYVSKVSVIHECMLYLLNTIAAIQPVGCFVLRVLIYSVIHVRWSRSVSYNFIPVIKSVHIQENILDLLESILSISWQIKGIGVFTSMVCAPPHIAAKNRVILYHIMSRKQVCSNFSFYPWAYHRGSLCHISGADWLINLDTHRNHSRNDQWTFVRLQNVLK